ncbi:hypothetical protein DBP19_35435 [Streptomyces sp. CS090A]|nr:hypothetical protein DBP19_35435 [Streptomyces sp. CS090A]
MIVLGMRASPRGGGPDCPAPRHRPYQDRPLGGPARADQATGRRYCSVVVTSSCEGKLRRPSSIRTVRWPPMWTPSTVPWSPALCRVPQASMSEVSWMRVPRMTGSLRGHRTVRLPVTARPGRHSGGRSVRADQAAVRPTTRRPWSGPPSPRGVRPRWSCRCRACPR